jgi:hypothetical protein
MAHCSTLGSTPGTAVHPAVHPAVHQPLEGLPAQHNAAYLIMQTYATCHVLYCMLCHVI